MNINDIRDVKNNLRSKYKDLRTSMSSKKKFELDAQIHSRLLSLDGYVKCSTVFTYVSKDFEIDTVGLIKTSLSLGKKVAVPKCVENNMMDFYFINSLEEDLSLGMFGVLEPLTCNCEKVEVYPQDSLCIVPGFTFDISGFRLGYGQGYYDRFLENYGGLTVGLCYNNFLRKELPRGKFDKSVRILVTDKNVRHTKYSWR